MIHAMSGPKLGRVVAGLGVAGVLAFTVAACGDDEESSGDGEATEEAEFDID